VCSVRHGGLQPVPSIPLSWSSRVNLRLEYSNRRSLLQGMQNVQGDGIMVGKEADSLDGRF
jgi:hypothetical protein